MKRNRKPYWDFSPEEKDRKRANTRRWRNANRAHIRKYKDENREKHLSYYYKSNYGITLDDYNRMLEAQGGVCYICKEPERHKSKLSVDHEHGTDIVRKLLCSDCNALLGFARESILILESAIRYLEEHK